MPINTHAFASEEVMAYLDGELPPETAAEITAHLARCKTCQEIAADLQDVSRQLSGWMVQAPDAEGIPEQILAAIQARAAERTVKHQHVLPWQFLTKHTWVAVAASVFVLIPVLLLFTTTRSAVHLKRVADSSRLAPVVSSPAYESTAIVSPGDGFIPTTKSEPVRSAIAPTLIVRTVDLRLTVRSFDTVRTGLDRILAQFGGHIAQLDIASPADRARALSATLRIPAPQLEAALSELRKLGRVDSESQRGEEVTQQSVDLEARLTNARHTEQRLTQILASRTGKLSDVLEVEEKLAEVRGQIEQAEAEQKSLNNRVAFATISLQVTEDYRAPLTTTIAPSIGTRLSNSAMGGLHTAFDSITGMIQAVLSIGPSLLLWGLILGLPAYFLWKKLRHR